MLIGIFMLILGLGLAGFTLYKIMGGVPDEMRTRWYGAALAGAILSIVGLILTIRGMKAPTVALTPSAPIKIEAPQNVALEPASTAPQQVQTEEEKPPPNVPILVWRQQQAMKRELHEDPNGRKYDKSDYEYFNGHIDLMNNGFDQMIKETITGPVPPDKANMSKNQLWTNFNWNLNIYAGNMKMRAAAKNGPGTAEIKIRVLEIYDSYIKMEAVYHNAVVNNQEPDYAYINDLKTLIDRHMKFINEQKVKQGIQ